MTTLKQINLPFNASHVITHFKQNHNEHNEMKIEFTQEGSLWRAKVILQGLHIETEQNCGFTSKKYATADLVLQFCKAKNIEESFDRYRTSALQYTRKNVTPKQALHEFVQKRKISDWDIKDEQSQEGHTIVMKLTHLDRPFEAKHGPNVDKSYAKHKAAKLLLYKLVFVDNLAWEYYSPLDGKARFRLGDVMKLEESEIVEFKGGDAPMAEYKYKQAKGMIENNDHGAGCYIGSFLNSKVVIRLLF